MKTPYWTWLRFFALILLALSPIASINDLISSWRIFPPDVLRKVWEVYPAFAASVCLNSAGIVFIVAYGIRVGSILWKVGPSGKSEAQRYLLLRLGVNLALIFISVAVVETTLSSEDKKSIFADYGSMVIAPLISETVFFVIWWLYFLKSKRVKETYG